MIRWTDEARADFEGQIAWIAENNPIAAGRMAEEVLARVEALRTFPYAGRPGRREGTRELVTAPRPYIVVYKVIGAAVVILRVLHGAQLWPRDEDGWSDG